MLNISLDKKLVGSNLSDILEKYWTESFKNKAVSFNFEKLEWISNSEITFLFSWIRTLEEQNIKVSISMQSFKEISTDSYEYKKRKYCYERILIQWRLRDHLAIDTKVIDGGISSNRNITINYANFLPLPLIAFNTTSFDQDFEAVYNHHFLDFSRKLKDALNQTEISYYDTKFLNYSIVKELYSNVCLHGSTNKSVECFFSVGINKKYSGDSDFVSEERLAELSELESDFFQEGAKYRNIDFVEINFHDFGIGIAESLKDKYLNETEKELKAFFGKYYEVHLKQQLDTRILEYALLLFTSRFEIDRKFEVHDFIPRGLFILKDIVKKYHGYFEVTSNTGAIALNFKGGITKISYGNNDKGTLRFPGTRIKIILPALKKENVKPKRKFTSTSLTSAYKIKNISFLKEFATTEFELKNTAIVLDNDDYRMRFTAVLFSKFVSDFKSLERGTVVMIDFAGIEPKTADFFNKFIYFITHFPLFGSCSLVIYNLLTKGLNSTVIFNDLNSLKSKGFFPYPIPCIYTDREVDWLGVDNKSIAENLTQLWIGNTTNEYTRENMRQYQDTVVQLEFMDDQYKVSINLPPFIDILERVETEITNTIDQEVKNNGIKFFHLMDEDKNYNNVVISKPKTCFLGSNGKYLLEYISFNEKLYIYQYRRMIATYFVFKLHNSIKDDVKVSKISKILSVTLSSQLIGNEVKDILNLLYNVNIDLVELSNYYNFQNEERFSEIRKSNKVIIVNDVISTGALTNRIIKSIEIMQAVPLSCLSIVDLRTVNPFPSDVPILSLAKFRIDDTEDPPKGFKVEVINPVLNVPTSMPKSKSRENVLMTRDEFLKLIEEKYLIIGNLKNISVHFNYFLKTHELLLDDSENGFPVLNQLLTSLKAKKQGSTSGELKFLSKGLEIVGKNINDKKLSAKIEKMQKEFSAISERLGPELFDEYQVDVVFYPFLSDMSVVENDTTPFLESSLTRNSPKIYPIPRIMTTRGWRLSFPPKFLNVLFKKNKLSVLIIDDGSLTGETIMQMIDSISFLSVKSIDVFSVFGRLEDFQKELFSRIKSVQVKDAVAPINIYFGTHFNIPVHYSGESPFHTELREISSMQEKLKVLNIELSEHFTSFITQRKDALDKTYYPNSKDIHFDIFPEISKKQLFIFRDFLGRFGSYRLYADDLPLDDHYFLIKDELSILTLLTVLNLEPQLYQTLKRIYSKEKIKDLIVSILDIFSCRSDLMKEVWMQEFYIKSLFYLNPDEFFKASNLIKLSVKLNECTSQGKSAFTYVEYLLILVKLNIKTIDNSFAYKSFETHVEEFIAQLKSTQPDIFNEYRFAFHVYTEIQKEKPLNYQFPINKYYKLSQYYLQALIHENKHDDRLLTNLFKEVNRAISVLIYAIDNNISEDIETNTNDLVEKLYKLNNNYYKYPEFKFIKDIVSDLKKYGTNDLELDVSLTDQLISGFENKLEAIPLYSTLEKIHELKEAIDGYQSLILAVNSDFVQFIVKSKSQLLDEWNIAEGEFLGKEGYKAINTEKAANFTLNVNPYALNLAFRNLLSNKVGYAKEVNWKLYTEEHDDYYEIFFEQESPFLHDKGDGTGQNTIKTILNNYGILYKRVNDNPYTLRMSFEKN